MWSSHALLLCDLENYVSWWLCTDKFDKQTVADSFTRQLIPIDKIIYKNKTQLPFYSILNMNYIGSDLYALYFYESKGQSWFYKF